ncbi:hypothetical protein CC80DRAFT_554248 [Byssothecium circinans]|uniref:Uncharacterized protein n=1 Tax=Byssothecium circinans TaxID=147558 RepID=A0A6A5TDW4_9PLEO|nr:hypothetical protein CC80DRAFT_554248 [Byssothecium circinans]
MSDDRRPVKPTVDAKENQDASKTQAEQARADTTEEEEEEQRELREKAAEAEALRAQLDKGEEEKKK